MNNQDFRPLLHSLFIGINYEIDDSYIFSIGLSYIWAMHDIKCKDFMKKKNRFFFFLLSLFPTHFHFSILLPPLHQPQTLLLTPTQVKERIGSRPKIWGLRFQFWVICFFFLHLFWFGCWIWIPSLINSIAHGPRRDAKLNPNFGTFELEYFLFSLILIIFIGSTFSHKYDR